MVVRKDATDGSQGTSPRTTLFTCSVFPDLTRLWFHFVRLSTDPRHVQVLIYDCGGYLDPRLFPGARIERFRNDVPHGIKIDHCIANVATPLLFICDDDAFLTSPAAEEAAAASLLANPRMAIYSFKARDYWVLEVAGKQQHPVGSYALVIRPSLLRDEALSFALRPTTDPKIRLATGYYDTADYAQEQLLLRAYEVAFAPPELQEKVPSFFGTSRGFMRFTRRTVFSRRRIRLRSTVDDLLATIATDGEAFEHACSIAGAHLLFQEVFHVRPQFDSFPTLADIDHVRDSISEPAARQSARETIGRVSQRVKTLLDVAGRAAPRW